MSAHWRFGALSRGMNIDPSQMVLFQTDDTENDGTVLLREAIQNSLDASLHTGPVRVRVSIAEDLSPTSRSYLRTLLEGLVPHFEVCNPTWAQAVSRDRCRLLVVEDFGTRGLTGDPHQAFDLTGPGPTNHFYYFWRNQGRSKKSDLDRGRWGLGKNVFPLVSEVQSFLGLTIPADTNHPLLMGLSVTKTHELNGQHLSPYGYFGEADGNSEDGFTVPSHAPGEIKKFTEMLGLKRRAESGLSIVIPFVDRSIALPSLLDATVAQYFQPIVSGELVVELESDGQQLQIDQASIAGHAEDVARRNSKLSTLPAMINLAAWESQLSEEQRELIAEPQPGEAPNWPDAPLEESRLTHMRGQFELGAPLAFRLPLRVQRLGMAPESTCFDVILERAEASERKKPHFVREGIWVPSVRARFEQGVRALVLIKDRPIASLIGDAENPAHTDWMPRISRMRQVWADGEATIRFVRESVMNLVRLLSPAPDELDRSSLLDVLWVPSDEAGASITRRRKRKGTESPTGGSTERRGAVFAVDEVSGGLRVTPGTGFPAVRPTTFTVEVAYDTRGSDPLVSWVPADFELNRPPMVVKVEGCDLIERGGRRLRIKAKATAFKVDITGFDMRRDVLSECLLEEEEQHEAAD